MPDSPSLSDQSDSALRYELRRLRGRESSRVLALLRRWYWRLVRRHAYEICNRCGRPVAHGTGPAWWSATDELWLEVEGSGDGVRCMPCFARDCLDVGIQVYWRPIVDAHQESGGRWISITELLRDASDERQRP